MTKLSTAESMSEQKAKELAKKQDGYECRFCSTTREEHKEEFGRDLHAHHIIKDNDGGIDHPRNFITVCRDCHTILEKTQADALSRIKERHEREIRDEYEQLIDEYEKDLIRERNDNNAETEIFAWAENRSIETHILLKGVCSPKLETYRDRDKAAKAYLEYDGSAKLVTRKYDVSDDVCEIIRFSSTDDVRIRYNPNASDYFENPEKFDEEQYLSMHVPEVLSDD